MRIIENESGRFYLTEDGVLKKFEPDTTEKDDYYCVLERLIIPEGVVKIGTQVLDSLKVTDEIRFPESLRAIGTEIWECGISWCDLPDVVLPEGVRELTSFAFGSSRIRSLRIPAGAELLGGRHFKGSYIGTLYVPKSLAREIDCAKGNNLICDRIVWYTE